MALRNSLLALIASVSVGLADTWMISPGQAGSHGGAPASPFLIEEGFEGGTMPTNFSQTTPGTAANFNYTTAPLTGSVSLYQSDPGGSGESFVDIDLSAYGSNDTIYVAWKWRPTVTTASQATVCDFTDSGDAQLASLAWRNTDGVLRTHDGVGYSSTNTAAVAGATTYRVKVRYVSSTDAITVWLSTDGVTWGTAVTRQSSVAANIATTFSWRIFNSRNYDNIIDSVRVDTDDIAVTDVP